MRIALLSPYPSDGRTPSGGVEAVAMYLINGFKSHNGLEWHVLTCNIEFQKRVLHYVDDIPIHIIPSSRFIRRITWYYLERMAIHRELRQIQPDIVHIQGTDMYGAAGVTAGFPNIVTVHGIAHKEAHVKNPAATAFQRFNMYLRGIGNSAFERYTLKRTNDIIVINPYVEDSILHLTSAQIHFIPNPIDHRFFETTRREVDGRILFVGRLDPKKRVQDLLHAISHVRQSWPKVELHIIGPTYEKLYHQMLVDYVNANDLVSNIKFLGWVNQEDLLNEYSRCSIVVLCSQEESSPLAIQQAMAAGKPVVASRAAGIPWLVEDGITGLLFETGDVELLAEAILYLLKDPLRRKEMGRIARIRAKNQFSPRKVASQTLSLYKKIFAARV